MTSNFQEISNSSFRKYRGNVSLGSSESASELHLLETHLAFSASILLFSLIQDNWEKKIIKCKTAELRAMSYVMFCRIQQHGDAEENNDFFFIFFFETRE